MAAIDFPSAPILNQVFAANNGVSYIWNGSIWITVSSGAAQASDTPPSNPVVNQLWFNSALGQLFIYYNDGSSSQWVPANPTPSGVPVGGGIVREVIVTTPQPTIDLFSITGIKSVKLIFRLKPTVNADIAMQRAVGTTVNTGAVYIKLEVYNGAGAPTTPGGGFAVNTQNINLASNNDTAGFLTGEITYPDIAGDRALGHMFYGTPAQYLLTYNGYVGPTGCDGFRFILSTGNFAAGSFVRVIGWQ